MLYILCEDEGSGFTFWKTINDVLLNSKAQVTTARGKDNILAKFVEPQFDDAGVPIIKLATGVKREIFLTAADTLFIVFDNIGGSFADNLLLDATEEQRRVGCDLIFTSYYCFEEVFLSFADLFTYCAFSNAQSRFNKSLDVDKIACQLSFLREEILENRDYLANPMYRHLFSVVDRCDSSGEPKNREQFAADYMKDISKNAVGCFRV